MDSHHCDPIPEAFAGFVRELLSGGAPPWPLVRNEKEIARFVAATAQHGVQPLLHHAALQRSISDSWPRVVWDEFSRNVAAAVALEAVRRADLERVLEACIDGGVRPLLMKGVALGLTHYESPAMRPRTDTDLLIAIADFALVRGLMLDLGYGTTWRPGRDLVFSQGSFTRDESYGFRHSYDFHWRVTNLQILRNALLYEECAERAVPLPGLPCGGLSDADALLLACIHRVAHHANTNRLIWLVDIHRLAAQFTEKQWQEFWQLAAGKRVASICAQSVEVAQEFLGRLPGVVVPRREKREPSRVLLRPISRAGLLWHDLVSMDRWTDRVRLVMQTALPAPASILRADESRALLPLAYARRLARGLRTWLHHR